MSEQEMFMVVTRDAWEHHREMSIDMFKAGILTHFPDAVISEITARQPSSIFGESGTVWMLAKIHVPDEEEP